MKWARGYHFLFGVTLLALAALGAWWMVFFMRSVELEKRSQMNDLVHATVVTALMFGHGDQAPRPGRLEGPVPLEIVSMEHHRRGVVFAPLVPRYPNLMVRPPPETIQAVEDKVRRRRIMLIGEGALLFMLIGVCSFMLFRLVRQERRHLKRMEDFVSSVTHEMKTPLTGIISMLQTFVDGRVPPEQQDKLYSMGLTEAERLEHMIENVLITGRLRTERYQTRVEEIDLRSMLTRFIEHRRRYLVGRPGFIRLQWELEPAEFRVLADPSALRIILENLTDNAIKYGGPAPEVTLRARVDGTRVLLSVEDRGIGFAPEKAEELFLPFRRRLNGDQAVKHGTGLGLTIARTLARRMKIQLVAESDGPGKGSRFTLVLKGAQA